MVELQRQFISLSARYGPEHPDVKSMARQIEAFQNEYGHLVESEDLLTQREQFENELQELTQKYSSEHPDVKKMQRPRELLRNFKPRTVSILLI